MTTYKIPQDIIDSLKRADVFQYHDWRSETIHLVSRNFKESLTDEEKERILIHLALRGFPLKVVFDN